MRAHTHTPAMGFTLSAHTLLSLCLPVYLTACPFVRLLTFSLPLPFTLNYTLSPPASPNAPFQNVSLRDRVEERRFTGSGVASGSLASILVGGDEEVGINTVCLCVVWCLCVHLLIQAPPAQVLPASGVMKPYPLASRLRVSQITPFGIKLVADDLFSEE